MAEFRDRAVTFLRGLRFWTFDGFSYFLGLLLFQLAELLLVGMTLGVPSATVPFTVWVVLFAMNVAWFFLWKQLADDARSRVFAAASWAVQVSWAGAICAASKSSSESVVIFNTGSCGIVAVATLFIVMKTDFSWVVKTMTFPPLCAVLTGLVRTYSGVFAAQHAPPVWCFGVWIANGLFNGWFARIGVEDQAPAKAIALLVVEGIVSVAISAFFFTAPSEPGAEGGGEVPATVATSVTANNDLGTTASTASTPEAEAPSSRVHFKAIAGALVLVTFLAIAAVAVFMYLKRRRMAAAAQTYNRAKQEKGGDGDRDSGPIYTRNRFSPEEIKAAAAEFELQNMLSV